MNRLRMADVFCGAGLFSQGFVQAGARPVFAVDLAPDAIETYNKNIAPVAKVGTVSADTILPPIDLLIAGPPCQGFSTLGGRDPADNRNSLCLLLPKFAEKAGAQMAIVENVPPFLASAHWQEMARAFVDLGFEIETWTLDAAHYGAAQRRSRTFTIASRIGIPKRPLESRKLKTVADAFAGIAYNDELHRWPEPTALAKSRMVLIPPLGDKRDVLRAAPELCPPSWSKMGAQAVDVWGRINPAQPANTIRCRFQNPSTGRYIHPTEDRVISLREGARLQGVPDEWQFAGHAYSVARQIGNGVPIPLSAAVAHAVVSHIRSLDQIATAA